MTEPEQIIELLKEISKKLDEANSLLSQIASKYKTLFFSIFVFVCLFSVMTTPKPVNIC
jgi:hypothetical protein